VTTGKRGGLSDDPETRKRQEEGLARGRAISAERRRQGLPSKRKERELEQRVIEGGQRGGTTRQRPKREETPRGATTKTKGKLERERDMATLEFAGKTLTLLMVFKDSGGYTHHKEEGQGGKWWI